MPDHPRHYVWTTKDKDRIAIKDMSCSHLNYTVKYLDQKVRALRQEHKKFQHIVAGSGGSKNLSFLKKFYKRLENRGRAASLYLHIMQAEQEYRKNNPHEQRPDRDRQS